MNVRCVTPTGSGAWTDDFQDIQCYDTLKVNAILNQIDRKTHLGNSKAPVPNIFGMNFQAVSVGQKLIEGSVKGGYLDAAGTPSPKLLDEITFVEGDNEITGWHLSDGDPGVGGLLGAKDPVPFKAG
jgi:hypothetical protein